jgi:hypothetical protein
MRAVPRPDKNNLIENKRGKIDTLLLMPDPMAADLVGGDRRVFWGDWAIGGDPEYPEVGDYFGPG